MRVLAAPDKFKGSLTAREVAAAIGHACWELGVDCVEVPMADGGDGLLDALGGANRETTVTGPLGDPVARRLAPGERHRRHRDGPRQRTACSRAVPMATRRSTQRRPAPAN